MTFINKFLSKLPNKFVLKLINNFVGYYDGQLHRFTLENEKLSFEKVEDDFSPKLIIVSSGFYQEKITSFPIDDKKVLTKILNVQRKEDEFSIIQSMANNQSKVNIWRFNQSIPKSWFIIPETFLYGENLNSGEVLDICNKPDSSLYTAQVDGGIYSANSSILIKTVALFGVSIGLSIQNHTTTSSTNKALLLVNCLVNCLVNLKFTKLVNFFKRPSNKVVKLAARQFIAPVVVGLILYFSITSTYLSIRTTLLESEIAAQTKQMTKLLDLQVSYDSKLNDYQALSDFWHTRPNTIGLWQVLAPVFNQAKVKSVVLRKRKF